MTWYLDGTWMEACTMCENTGEVQVGKNDTMTCPLCAGLGLVPHQCGASS